ncbi:hypothetical protein C8J56DRAFT_888620 [Mycena floridula]|nr:hypothetical protein C8J56DRAFT_888620 [Mycena floridula]
MLSSIFALLVIALHIVAPILAALSSPIGAKTPGTMKTAVVGTFRKIPGKFTGIKATVSDKTAGLRTKASAVKASVSAKNAAMKESAKKFAVAHPKTAKTAKVVGKGGMMLMGVPIKGRDLDDLE